MLFNHSLHDANKARNLYSKIFCGCLFNELIPNNYRLTSAFFDLLSIAYLRTCESFSILASDYGLDTLQQLKHDIQKEQGSYVHFDQHLFKGKECGQKAADIFITTRCNLVAIGTNYQVNWQFQRDVEKQFQNIQMMELKNDQGNLLNVIQVLLVSKNKWKNNKNLPDTMKHYKKLRNYLRHDRGALYPFIVLFW